MNDQEQLNKFLSEQDYMTIAVTLDDGTPWVTPVRIKQWEGAAFEWMSKTDTEHSRAIAVRPQVALSMYTPGGDTTIQPTGPISSTGGAAGGAIDGGGNDAWGRHDDSVRILCNCYGRATERTRRHGPLQSERDEELD